MATTKIKVYISCRYCDGKAYVKTGEAIDLHGDTYSQFSECKFCGGSGLESKIISLEALARLIDTCDICAPDYSMLAEKEPTSELIDSLEAAGLK